MAFECAKIVSYETLIKPRYDYGDIFSSWRTLLFVDLLFVSILKFWWFDCQSKVVIFTLFVGALCSDKAIQYNTIQYNTIQYNTIQYNTIQYNTIQYNTIQYNTILTYLNSLHKSGALIMLHYHR